MALTGTNILPGGCLHDRTAVTILTTRLRALNTKTVEQYSLNSCPPTSERASLCLKVFLADKSSFKDEDDF
jgi:hypothetical protein